MGQAAPAQICIGGLALGMEQGGRARGAQGVSAPYASIWLAIGDSRL